MSSTPIADTRQRGRIKLLEIPPPDQIAFTSNALAHSNIIHHNYYHPDEYYLRVDALRPKDNFNNKNSLSDSSFLMDKNPYVEHQGQHHLDFEKSSIYSRRGYRNSLRISENSPTLSNGRNTLSQNCDS